MTAFGGAGTTGIDGHNRRYLIRISGRSAMRDADKRHRVAVTAAGLDLYAGFLHVFRHGRPSDTLLGRPFPALQRSGQPRRQAVGLHEMDTLTMLWSITNNACRERSPMC